MSEQLMIQPQGFENHFSDYDDGLAFERSFIGSSYSFALDPDYYNDLPMKVKKFLWLSGNTLHMLNARHSVYIRLMEAEFRLFNEMMWTQIGHS